MGTPEALINRLACVWSHHIVRLHWTLVGPHPTAIRQPLPNEVHVKVELQKNILVDNAFFRLQKNSIS